MLCRSLLCIFCYCTNKASRKTEALLGIKSYISTNTAKLLYNAYILLQFIYCPIIWMGWDKKLNAKIKKVHQKSTQSGVWKFWTNFIRVTDCAEHRFSIHIRFAAYRGLQISLSIHSSIRSSTLLCPKAKCSLCKLYTLICIKVFFFIYYSVLSTHLVLISFFMNYCKVYQPQMNKSIYKIYLSTMTVFINYVITSPVD